MNKCMCVQDVALYNCCNIEYNHGKIFTMVAKPMKIGNYNHCNLQFFPVLARTKSCSSYFSIKEQ